MKILVVGASHGTGALAVKAALDHGHEVTAFSRNPERLELEHPRLHKFQGDFHQYASVNAAMPGQEVVIITAALPRPPDYKKTPDFFSRGTRHVVDAMKAHGARRVVILSALGVGEGYALLNPLHKFLVNVMLREAYVDHALQEQMARGSGLEWTPARPNRLSNGPARGQFEKQIGKKVPSSISRADVAAFLVEAAETDAWLGKVVNLGG